MQLLWLDEIDPEDRGRVGGKGAALARLHQRGLPVPSAFVVPSEALLAFLEHNSLLERARQGRSEIIPAIEAGILPPVLARDLRQATARLGDLLAVRSSAAEEDAAEASHAGQYHSEIGVRPGDETEQALKRCWASAWGRRVLAYRPTADGEIPRVAVVVQLLIQPRCAGVLFTINPASGSWGEMTVEAAWGLGESVVGGHVVPDLYRVRRPRRTPRPIQRLLARLRLEVVEEAIRPQAEEILPAPGGARAVPIAPPRRDAAKLTREELLKLCRLGLRAEALLGGPQDVEWALDHGGAFHVLQSRPVTTARDIRRSGPVAWTRRFVGERWTEPATPLGWSEMQDLLHWFIAYPVTARRYLGGEEPTRLVRFAPYVNATVFRHLAFKVPGAAPPRFMLELLPPEEERRWLRRRAAPPDLRVYASILNETFQERRWQRFRWNPFLNWKAWQEFEARLDRELAVLAEVKDHRSARTRIERCRELAREYIKIHICSLLFANIWFEAAQAALQADGLESRANVLLQPPARTATARTNAALWRLGRGEIDLEAFLEEFGHRASSSWELFSPRWREQPERALALARTAASGPDPEVVATSRQQEVDRALQGLPLAIRPLVQLARRYLQLREDQRFYFDRLLWRWKEALLFLERDLDLEIRYLEKAELEALLDGELDPGLGRSLVERRRKEFQDEVARRARGDEPPAFLVGDEVVEQVQQAQRLNGQGISAGVATGPARVLRSLDEASRLRPGDILVTRATDPGWTPVFHAAAGLVMELGGMLSHGAVVAREYGLPAVVNIPDATRLIADGQTITVDGGRGTVWLR